MRERQFFFFEITHMRIQLVLAPKRITLSSSSFFHWNLEKLVIILVYNNLKNDLFEVENILDENE